VGSHPLPPGATRHLAAAYGDRAWEVLQVAGSSRERVLAAPLVEGHPYLAAEVVYCCRWARRVWAGGVGTGWHVG
jgi:hypothetical protein